MEIGADDLWGVSIYGLVRHSGIVLFWLLCGEGCTQIYVNLHKIIRISPKSVIVKRIKEWYNRHGFVFEQVYDDWIFFDITDI